MRNPLHRPGIGYWMAAGITPLVVGMSLALEDHLSRATAILLLIFPVVAAGYCGGFRPGLFATLLGSVASGLFFLFPGDSQTITAADATSLAFFAGLGLFISWLYESLHAARRQASSHADQQQAARERAEAWKERYEAAVLSSGSILYDSNRRNGQVIYGGDCEAILGYTADELAGDISKWIALIHPDDRALFLREVDRTNAEPSPYQADYRMIGKDGRTIWMRDDGHFTLPQSGELADRMLGLVKDVTHQRQTEMKMALLSQRLTNLVDNTPLAVIEWDSQFKITRWAGQSQHTFGWTAAEVLGTSLFELPVVGETQQVAFQASIRGLAQDEVNHTVFASRNIRKDGASIHCQWYNSVLRDADGCVIAVLSLILDTTNQGIAEAKLRDSEELFRHFTDAMPQVVWIADADGTVQHYSNRVQNFAGATRNADQTWEWRAVLHRDDLRQTIEAWDHAVRTRTVYQCEHRVHMADGSCRWHLSRALPAPCGKTGAIRWFGSATDIHDLKVSQEALRESENRFRAFMDNNPACAYLKDDQGRYLFVNRTMETTSGRALADWIGRTDSELATIGDDGLPVPMGDDAASTPQQGRSHREMSVHHRGREHHFLTFAFPVIGHDGREMQGGISLDITDRKLAELQARAERARVQFVADAVPALISYIDTETRYRLINRAYETWFGMPCAEMLGQTMRDVLGEAAWEALMGYIDSALAGNLVRYEAQIPYRSGGTRWISATYTPDWDQDGQVCGFVAHVNDITARHRAEEELKSTRHYLETMIETAPSLIVVVNSSGEVCMFNRACELLSGYHREEVVGRPLSELLAFEEDREQLRHLLQAAESAEPCDPHENHWATQQGDPRLIEWRCTPLNPIGSNAEPLMLGIGVDVTQRRKMEDELRDQADRLAETDRRKDEFIATLAHELRNPLAPIRMGLELLRMVGDDPATREETRTMMERQTLQLITLVDDLLDVSRITRGKLELRLSKVLLSDIVQSAIEACRPGIDEAQHELCVSLPDEPVYLQADPHRLAQVLSNLLNNAAKYTSPGGKLEIVVRHTSEEVVMEVHDNGAGIAPEMQEQIFDMFAQIDRSQERGYTGLGIGLTLVKSLVEMHGGTVHVASEGVGCGSRFTVRVPVGSSSGDALKSDTLPSEVADAAVASPTCRVLVVDDNQAAVDMLRKVVQLLGHDVRAAYSGHEALQIGAEFRPHAVVMDIGMPGMDGHQTAREMRRRDWGKHALLVALTGWGQEEDRRQTRDAGFDHHLFKPAEPAEIQQLLLLAANQSR